MASPQKENGYTPIAHEILEALAKARLNGSEFRVIMHLLRNTYGFNKKEYRASLSKIGQAIGMNRINVKRTMDQLLSKRITVVVESDNTKIITYSFNKNFDDWCCKTVIEMDNKTVIESDNSTVIEMDNKTVIESDNSEPFLPLDERNKKKKKNINKRTSEFHNFFWPSYPVKKSKQKALALWESLAQKQVLPPIEKILSAIDSQKNEKKTLCNSGLFCPEWKHPTTWLYQGCWDDEPVSIETNGKKPWHF